jgi:parvulin-like peptidyl-prolyl isomerase
MLLTVMPLYAKVVDKTVATVNGEAIMLSEYNKIMDPVIEQFKQAAPAGEQSQEKLKELRQRVIDQMIDDRILKQEAKTQKIKVTKRELEDGMKEVKSRFAGEAEFQAELKKENMTMLQFEKRIEDQLMVMKLIEKEIKAKTPAPSDADIKTLYDQIIAKVNGKNLGLEAKQEEEIGQLAKYFARATAEQVRARHILVSVNKNATQKEKDEALKKVKDIQKQLKAGADFSEMAKKYSDDPGSKNRGGDLGSFVKGDMVPAFETAAFNAKVGEISEPILTDFGYHLIKVDEKKASRTVTLEEAKNDLQQYLYQRNAQKRYEDWMKGMRAKASIKVNSLE